MANIEKHILSGQSGRTAHMQYDISPVFADAEAFRESAEYMYQMFERELFDIIVAVDSAGLVFASSVASRMGKPLAVVSSENHCLGKYVSERIETRHGEKTFCMSADSVSGCRSAAVICDSLSYGKDVAAAVSLLGSLGCGVSKIGTFFEDRNFNARRKLLKGIPVDCMVDSDDL